MNDVTHGLPSQLRSVARQGDSHSAAYTVQLLGFNDRERTLFGSIFALSKHREIRYVEFNPDVHPHADYFIVDSEDAEAVESFFMIDPGSCGGGIFVGTPAVEALRGYPVIHRPIRWAEVMLHIDALPRPAVSAESARLMAVGLLPASAAANRIGPSTRVETGNATIARAEDDLELSQIPDWYDRSKITEFRTEPAVLVVDGDLASRRYMAAKLMDLNYRVDYAQSADQAMQLLAGSRYNAVFIDPAMPGIDGYDLARKIKGRDDRRRVAVIFATDKPSAIERVRASIAGADVFLAKPFDQSKLVATLDKFLPNWRIKPGA
ncbi:response regulator [Derxia lacustris]|uniref:response regulator n=1 Tax=Derxia lacustris TaxID=764842 RepID=UPI000A16FD68|nr:response regulator [Derxia lacustris]